MNVMAPVLPDTDFRFPDSFAKVFIGGWQSRTFAATLLYFLSSSLRVQLAYFAVHPLHSVYTFSQEYSSYEHQNS